MKVLWVLNKAIGKLAETMNISTDGYGGWLDQSLNEIKNDNDLSMVYLTSGNVSEVKTVSDGKDVYYLVPGGSAYSGFKTSKKNEEIIKGIIDKEKPEIIQLWGTESALGSVVASVSCNIPIIVYIQGFMNSIDRNYFESTTEKYLKKHKTFYDIVKRKSITKAVKQIKKKAKNERNVLTRADSIVCDSSWCEAVCKAINPQITSYTKKLPIDEVFLNAQWKDNDSHTVFCASQYGPFKGFEILLRALAMVRDKYPDVLLIVPGGWDAPPKTIREKLTYNGYSYAMNSLISELKLEKNVKNAGSITRKQMAGYMSGCEVFVQSSTAENHSSTLREAMFVGTPCIASCVGSTPEHVFNGQNGYLFKNNEPELLAHYIIRLFEDKSLRIKLGAAARKHINEFYQSEEIDYSAIYSDIKRRYLKQI